MHKSHKTKKLVETTKPILRLLRLFSAKFFMKPDDFESRLQRQPLRQVPPAWRGEILAATVGRESKVESRGPAAFRPSTLVTRLSALLWPHPKAWAGLAAVWMLVFAVNFSMRDGSPRLAAKSAPPSPEVMVELKKQQRMFAELVGANEPLDADRRKIFSPKPRSERWEILTA